MKRRKQATTIAETAVMMAVKTFCMRMDLARILAGNVEKNTGVSRGTLNKCRQWGLAASS